VGECKGGGKKGEGEGGEKKTVGGRESRRGGKEKKKRQMGCGFLGGKGWGGLGKGGCENGGEAKGRREWKVKGNTRGRGGRGTKPRVESPGNMGR
jgi:hypothetical protein